MKQLQDSKSEEELIQEEADILMANYLSEIEKLGITKKEIAEKIKTSPSYLTQVFRGDKPLNFITLAKIQRALKVRFTVQMEPANYIAENSSCYIKPTDNGFYFLPAVDSEKEHASNLEDLANLKIA